MSGCWVHNIQEKKITIKYCANEDFEIKYCLKNLFFYRRTNKVFVYKTKVQKYSDICFVFENNGISMLITNFKSSNDSIELCNVENLKTIDISKFFGNKEIINAFDDYTKNRTEDCLNKLGDVIIKVLTV